MQKGEEGKERADEMMSAQEENQKKRGKGELREKDVRKEEKT